MLLTTRSKELRLHLGQIALPRGERDAGASETAVSLSLFPSPFISTAVAADNLLTFLSFGQFREANEEVAFPLCSPHVHTLCTLDPFVSRNELVVTPNDSKPDECTLVQSCEKMVIVDNLGQ